MDPATKKLYLEQLARDARSVGGGIFHVKGTTPSMLGSGGAYAGNSVVVLPQKEYAPGDDVIFEGGPGGDNTLHRVTHVRPGAIFTKGTFNTSGDGWIELGRVKGKVVQTVRRK